MSFFKNIFGGKKKDTPPPTPPTPPYTDFSEGDIFYTILEKRYHLFKVLKVDDATNTLHVMGYEPLNFLPPITELGNLFVGVYHAPIAKNGFTNPQFLTTSTLVDDDFKGYHEYIKQIHHVDELIRFADKYYKEAYALSSEKKHHEAIAKYSLSVDLIPNFFEAIDNRAFCYMDLGNWDEAIKGFELSLSVNPVSLLAEFSIGECFLRLGNYARAKEQFEKAIAIDPNHKLSHDFLAKAMAGLG